MTKRFLYATGFAVIAAVVLVASTASACFPLCVLYTPDDPYWLVFACWTCGA